MSNVRSNSQSRDEGFKEVNFLGQYRKICEIFSGSDELKGSLLRLKKLAWVFLILFFFLGAVVFFYTMNVVKTLALGLFLILVLAKIISARRIVMLKRIPSMHVGVPMHLAERQSNYLLKEGWAIVIGGVYEHIVVNMKLQNLDFVVAGKDKDGVGVGSKVSFSVRPRRDKLCEYLDAGGNPEGEKINIDENQTGVADIIVDMIDDVFTEIFKNNKVLEIYSCSRELKRAAAKKIFGDEIIASSGELNISTANPHYVEGMGLEVLKLALKDFYSAIDPEFEEIAKADARQKKQRIEANTKVDIINILKKGIGDGKLSDERVTMLVNELELAKAGAKVTPGTSALFTEAAELLRKGGDIASIINMFRKVD